MLQLKRAYVVETKGKASKRSLFCKKAPQKTFVLGVRERAAPTPPGEKIFCGAFF
jgi:hypothetical protein